MASATPDYMATLDGLFGGGSASDFLSKLLGPSHPATAAAQSEAPVPDVGPTGPLDLNNVDSVAEYAARNGWADPRQFDVTKLVGHDVPRYTDDDRGLPETTSVDDRFTDDYAASRGMGTKFVPNTVSALYRRGVVGQQTAGNSEDPGAMSDVQGYVKDGYRVLAGEVKDQKRPTHLYHVYDKDGKFSRTDVDVETKWYEDIAPLVGVAGMALTMGGGAGFLGSALNSSMGLGLGSAGTAALGGAAIGGGSALLTGQNPLKGAALGGIGGAVSAANPAGLVGITNPVVSNVVNSSLTGGVKSSLTGGDFADGVVNGAINAAIPTGLRFARS